MDVCSLKILVYGGGGGAFMGQARRTGLASWVVCELLQGLIQLSVSF